MNANTRTTRECPFESLRPEMLAAVREHMELYKIGNIESNILICCETTSIQKKNGLFGGSEKVITVALLTSEWLILAVEKANEKPDVISGRLRNLQAQNFEDTAMFKISPDSGLNVTGRYSDVTKQGISFIGLGPELAAQKFRQLFQEAIRKQANT
jgi:hypothetical protein